MRFVGLRSLVFALTFVGLGAACHRSPRVRYIAYGSVPIVTELTPPPCPTGARPGTIDRRLAATPMAASHETSRLVVRVLSSDADTAISGALVGIDARRATSTPAAGVFVWDSLAPKLHRVHVNGLGFLPLSDSLATRVGYADTLVAHLALWCR